MAALLLRFRASIVLCFYAGFLELEHSFHGTVCSLSRIITPSFFRDTTPRGSSLLCINHLQLEQLQYLLTMRPKSIRENGIYLDAFVQGGMIGDLSFMESEFIQSFLAGMSASGTLTSALRFITKAAFENSRDGLRKGTILFFAISASFELVCVFLYAHTFPKLPIVKYYRSKAAIEGSKTVLDDLAAAGMQALLQEESEDSKQHERLSNKELLLQNMDYAMDLILTYVLTLSIFPGFLSEDTGSHSLGEWYSLILIAMFNVWDLVGRYVPLLQSLKLESRTGLTIAALSRFSLIPAFYFTAKYGDQGWMIMLTSFLGLTNGYLTVCILTSAPKGYKGPEQNALGNLLVLFLLGGIFAGVSLDWLWLIGKGW